MFGVFLFIFSSATVISVTDLRGRVILSRMKRPSVFHWAEKTRRDERTRISRSNIRRGWWAELNTQRLYGVLSSGRVRAQRAFRTNVGPTFAVAVDAALGRAVCAGHQSTTVVEVHDRYAAQNGTWWLLCENVDRLKSVTITITSYLNAMSVVMVYGQTPAADMTSVNISVNVKYGTYPPADLTRYILKIAANRGRRFTRFVRHWYRT